MGSGPHDAEVSQEVLGVGAGPSLVPLAAQLPLDETAIEIEESEPIRLDPPASTSPTREWSERFVIARPPSPATTPYTGTGRPENARRTFWPTMPPAPTANAFSTTITCFAFASALRISSAGQGRKQPMPESPDALVGVAELVDDILDRPDHRSERDDDRVGVV